MTPREAAIVSTYTGYLIGSFSDMAEYCEKLLDRPIWTHQYPELRDELREKSKADFVSIPVVQERAPDIQEDGDEPLRKA